MEQIPERLVVITSTPQGASPLSPGERSMLEHEPEQVEQIAVTGRSFPDLLPDDPARGAYEAARKAFAESNADVALTRAREAIHLRPSYLPAHLYEELAMNIARGRNLDACVMKCLETITLGERMLDGTTPAPPTETAVERDHILDLLDMAHYNLSDRYMRLGKYANALEQVRQSESLPKSTEAMMKRRIKEASLLFRLRDMNGCKMKLKQARDMDRELFYLLRERMAFDGHAGVDQPI